MTEPALNLAQIKALGQFPHKMAVTDIRYLVTPGVVEVRALYFDDGWPMGKTVYLWYSSEGQMLANASSEMADAGGAPTFTELSERKYIVIGRRFPDWRKGNGARREQEQVQGQGFFGITDSMGIVPDLRVWCNNQIKE